MKPLASESERWSGAPYRAVTWTATGVGVPEKPASCGVSTVIRDSDTARTTAGALPNTTRTGLSKPPPRTSTISPPFGLPTFGLTAWM